MATALFDRRAFGGAIEIKSLVNFGYWCWILFDLERYDCNLEASNV
jgi:hypothetical protein